LTLTVDNHTETVTYGQFSTVQSVASGLAAKFSQDCTSPMKAHAVGSLITFTSDYEQVSDAEMWDTSDFSKSSFGIAQGATPSPTAPSTLTPSLTLSCAPNPIPSGGS